ncbi:MAG: hypothetical protein Ct9H300mP18_13420 [Candidatus Neomarinimicrobiota bacterium]|nr:MAG: hypothetical protein Ct9H300mP18_13420 [Candidatus Neomarinimicrobiota bacterium]
MPIKKGQEVELTIESLGYGGKGIPGSKILLFCKKKLFLGKKSGLLFIEKEKVW